MEELELINESIENVITEITENLTLAEKRKIKNQISNLKNYNDKIYKIFENDNTTELKTENEKLASENEFLINLLAEKLSFNELQYLKIKYQIEL